MRRHWTALLLVAVLVLALVIQDVDSAKAKGSKKSSKSKDKVDKPVAEKKSGAKEKQSEDAKESDAKDSTEKEVPKKKKWNQMKKEDWERLEREAEGPGEPFKPPEPPKVDFDPKNPMKYMQATKKGKPGMFFCTLDKIKDETTGKMRERTKEETEEMSFRLKSLMNSGHLDASPYVIDPGKILWTVQDGSKGYEIKKFLFTQPEVIEFEWDQQKTTRSTYNPDAEPDEL